MKTPIKPLGEQARKPYQPFWLSATFETIEIIVADNLPASHLHWLAFGGNGNSPHLQASQTNIPRADNVPIGFKTTV